MILPTLRSSLSRRDAQQIVDLLGRHDESLRDGAQDGASQIRVHKVEIDRHEIGLRSGPRTLS